jgi:RNA polymerase sigma-70 factor, ECF subfamily
LTIAIHGETLTPRLDSDDRRLIERCLRGDAHAQRELFRRERVRVRARLRQLLGHDRDVDDLVQDVFLAVFRGLRAFRGDSSLATWIDRCTVRAAFARLRRERARPRFEGSAEDTAAVTERTERLVLAREALARLQEILGRVRGENRRAFALHAIEGYPVAEVAAIMQSTVLAIKARARRARRYVEGEAELDPALTEYVPPARRRAL